MPKVQWLILIASVITAILEYSYQVLMAHFFSPNTFGILSVSLSIFWIFAIILTSGVKISMAKFIAEDTDKERVSSYLFNGYHNDIAWKRIFAKSTFS